MSDKKYVAYVGTYTHGSSIGIHLYDIDVEEGTLAERKVVPVNNSSHICRSLNGKYLYSIADEGVAVFAVGEDGDLHLINKVDFDDGFARYELNGESGASGHRHHHAICTKCGKVYSLETDLLDTLEQEVFEKLGFMVTDHEVKLYGLCRECRSEKTNGKKL